jgi:O-antigen/teichoic acid export membrane protein
MSRHHLALMANYAVSVTAAGLTYIVFSQRLGAPEFALYAVGLTAASLALLVVDGGLKTTLVRRPRPLRRATQAQLFATLLFSAVALCGLVALAQLLPRTETAVIYSRYIGTIVAIYIVTYPPILIATSDLERRLSFGLISTVEAASNAIERGLPALLVFLDVPFTIAVPVSMLLGRGVRCIVLSLACRLPVPRLPERRGLRALLLLLKDSFAVQAAYLMGVFRDNPHVFILGPVFGASWTGYYAWVIQLCTITSQSFCQIAVRIALPSAAQRRHDTSLSEFYEEVRRVNLLVLPIVATTVAMAPSLDTLAFGGKWSSAMPLLLMFSIRMAIGTGITLLGPQILVRAGTSSYARYHVAWTLVELAMMGLLLFFFGPYAWAVAVVPGAFAGLLLARRVTGLTCLSMRDYLRASLASRSAWLSCLLALAAFFVMQTTLTQLTYTASWLLLLVLCVAVPVCSWVFDPKAIDWLRSLIGSRKKAL